MPHIIIVDFTTIILFREEEGIELQVLSGSKTADVVYNSSFNEPTDDDSIISLEVGARAASSTIDFKVDVHRKNSSESSEELSFNPSGTDAVNSKKETEEVSSLKESVAKTPEIKCKLRRKHNHLKNNKLRLKIEERIAGIDGDDFILSQSDCHIAKLRKGSLEELSGEYKMSQSDCHISNLSQKSVEKDVAQSSCVQSTDTPNHYSGKIVTNKKTRMFGEQSSCELKSDQKLTITEKNKSFDMGNLTCNGSCGILTLNQSSNKDLIKNTGSLELPLKDIESKQSADKGNLFEKFIFIIFCTVSFNSCLIVYRSTILETTKLRKKQGGKNFGVTEHSFK